MQDLKQRTVRGGVARMGAQGATFALRLGSLMVLARVLEPKDFGLVGMVTAFTGVLNLFRDFGLSAAAVQRTSVTEEESSTLFWINMLVGVVLGLLAVAAAPAIAAFYHEPKLIGVTVLLALGFPINAAGVQHSALLQRQMRFTTLAVIGVISLVGGAAVAIGGAEAGYGYWALVAMTVVMPLIGTIGFWLSAAWLPGLPHKLAGIRSMMRFGGTLTLNGLVAYVAYNLEKVLIGRFWGIDAIGIYGRAYQLINIPTENLNSAVGEVAFSALSRVQDDPARFKSYFLKGYSLVLGLTLPVTMACALFAHDLIFILLGPKWKDAAPIFRLLAPTIAIFAIINPLGWLLTSLGLVGRGLEDCSRICADLDWRLRYRFALWAQRDGIRIFGSHGVVGHSAYCVVCTRYSYHRSGHTDGGEPAAGFSHLGWRARLWRAVSLRLFVVSLAAAGVRKRGSSSYVCWDTLVPYGTKITLPGSSSHLEKAVGD